MSDDPVEERLRARWNECGYYRSIGMEVTRADTEGSDFRLQIGAQHLQAYGTAHGGVLAGLLDAAMGLAICGRFPDEDCATIEMKINFLAGAPPGAVEAHGRVASAGRRIVVATAEAVHESGRTVAMATGTFQRVPRPVQ